MEGVLRLEEYDVILAGFRPQQDFSDWVRRRGLDGVSVVLTDTEPELQQAFPNVGIDDTEGAYLATRHLIDLGHRAVSPATLPTTAGWSSRFHWWCANRPDGSDSRWNSWQSAEFFSKLGPEVL